MSLLCLTALAAAGAVLEGTPAALVDQVARGLEQRGVATGAGADPGAVRVTIAEEPGGIRVVLRDRDGRGTERLVASVDGAAALIESWTRPDLVDPLLAGRASPPASGARPLPPPEMPAGTPRLRLGLESALGTDRSLWWGASLGGCLGLGRFCVGLLGRFAADGFGRGRGRARFRETEPATLARLAIEGLLSAELELAPRLALGAGLGVGRLASDARRDDFGRQVSAVGLRGDGRIGVALPVSAQLLLDLELAVALAPTARRSPSRAGYFTVPGDPLAQIRLGLGARWGR
jgi:hypothetical protein